MNAPGASPGATTDQRGRGLRKRSRLSASEAVLQRVLSLLGIVDSPLGVAAMELPRVDRIRDHSAATSEKGANAGRIPRAGLKSLRRDVETAYVTS